MPTPFDATTFDTTAFDADSGGTVSASLTASAILQREQVGSGNANALLLRTQALDVPAGSVLLRAQPGSLSVAAFIQPFFTAGAWIASLSEQTASLAADAIIRRSVESSFSTWSIVKAQRSASLGGEATFLKGAQSSLSAAAFIQPFFTAGAWIIALSGHTAVLVADAVLRRGVNGSATVDAVRVLTRSRNLTANAQFRKFGIVVRRTVDACLAGPVRNTHDRGTPPHYDNDLDSVIVLAQAIGVYQQGADLHTVLTAIVQRVADLEAQ